MKISKFRVALALAVIGVLMASAVAYAAAKVTTTDVLRFSDMSTVAGASSTLVRTNNGVSMTIVTNDLPPGAYTNWWVVFDNPAACSGGVCGEDDVLPPNVNPAAEVSVIGPAAGNVVGPNGMSGFAGRLAEGDTSGALWGDGLDDAMTAQIHLIVRSHGEVIPGMVADQISSLNGGCPPNTCEEIQFAVHLP